MKKLLLFFIVCLVMLSSATYAQSSPAKKMFPTTFSSGIPADKTIYGVFEGRIPCQEISRQLHITASAACTKRKVGLFLFHDPVTNKPTTYKISGMGTDIKEGEWHIIKGMPGNADAIIYQLDTGRGKLYLLRGDDNVLFVLDNNKNFLIGNADFSYTLNGVRNKLPGETLADLINKG